MAYSDVTAFWHLQGVSPAASCSGHRPDPSPREVARPSSRVKCSHLQCHAGQFFSVPPPQVGEKVEGEICTFAKRARPSNVLTRIAEHA